MSIVEDLRRTIDAHEPDVPRDDLAGALQFLCGVLTQEGQMEAVAIVRDFYAALFLHGDAWRRYRDGRD